MLIKPAFICKILLKFKIMIFYLNVGLIYPNFCDAKLHFHQPSLQSSVSHDPLESIVNCFINVGKSCAVSVCLSSHIYLYGAFYNTDYFKANLQR